MIRISKWVVSNDFHPAKCCDNCSFFELEWDMNNVGKCYGAESVNEDGNPRRVRYNMICRQYLKNNYVDEFEMKLQAYKERLKDEHHHM